MSPRLHMLQEERVAGNTMPARRVEVSGVNEHDFRDRLRDSSGEPAPLAAPRSQRQSHQDRGPTQAR
jgi:hypothetical protein